MRSRSPILVVALVAAAVIVVEAAAVTLARPPGGRLRPFVDLLALEGLLVAVIGGLLAADRPFLAARALRRRAAGEAAPPARDDPPSSGEASPRRRAGWTALGLGAGLFALAAALWAIAAEPGN